MRHVAYRSLGRMIFVAFVFIVLVASIAAGIMRSGRQDDSLSRTTTATEQGPAVASPPPTTSIDSRALDEAVYAFVEAYNLPASNRRNSALKSLSTAEGYAMVLRDPQNLSPAEKAAGNISIKVIEESSSVQAEPFDADPNSVSVYVMAKVRLVRDGRVLRTVRLPGQTMSWVKQSGTWKFVYLQT